MNNEALHATYEQCLATPQPYLMGVPHGPKIKKHFRTVMAKAKVKMKSNYWQKHRTRWTCCGSHAFVPQAVQS
eukprot:scaffold541_cov253-Chaetoceros_neogracile.AAC.3